MIQHSWGPPPTLSPQGMTLERHILERQRSIPGATGDFTGLFQQIALAAKIINSRVRQAGLAGILGLTGDRNVQGEEVQKLDEFAHNVLVRSVEAGGHLCLMASEESADPIRVPEQFPTGKYVLLFDPLDGSSNIDVDISIGTIFSVHRRVTVGRNGSLADCLQRGSSQVAAGYVIYGSSTVLVYSTGDGVHGFTLDPSVGEFFLSHENIKVPARGKSYSVNEGNTHLWDDNTRRWVEHLKTPREVEGKVSANSARYVGSLVADFHRTLLKGGVFAYPADRKSPEGKLRLLYEAAPMAFICEAAGGAASDGQRRIHDIEPQKLHQRTPLYIGSRDDVALAEAFLRGESA
ncbi:MAG: class 1 fructose-bisphosphatase [Myxococcales bacterium]|nr:class 1 fructose-bisphosphatase [Myxococcales bacterium]